MDEVTGELLLELFVEGLPKPKGSLRHIGKGRMVEQVKGSTTWKDKVSDAVQAAVLTPDSGVPLRYEGAVSVNLIFLLPQPKSRKGKPATSQRDGDVDKHSRNVLDSLQAGGLLKNDSQVTELYARKQYGLDRQGVVIRVRTLVTGGPA
jgi:crossover junction endodeoxyribonuclease RusA